MLNFAQRNRLTVRRFGKTRFPQHNNTKPPVLNIATVYEDLIGGLGLSFVEKRQVPCFYHNDSKPSMTLYFRTNTFFCFTCRKWGGPYDIIMQIKGITFKEALEEGKMYL